MIVTARSTLGDFADDLRALIPRARRDMNRVVRTNIRDGNQIGRQFARETSGAHGKHFPNAWTAEMTGPTTGEFGPDRAMPQGNMEFEEGSVNQPPHRNAARAFDLIAPRFHRDVQNLPEKWFW